MKKVLIIICLAGITLIGSSQNDSLLIFNLRDYSPGDTIHFYDDAGLRTTRGRMDVQIRFDSLDCDDAYFDAGYTLEYDGAPAYPVSYGEISFPLQLDTAATRPAPNDGQLLFARYKTSVEYKWTFVLRYDWDRGQNVYTIMTGGCSRGRFWRLR